MKKFRKLIYKNFFGEHNTLVTVSSDGKLPHREILVPDREIYEARIWIHDNVVVKLHVKSGEINLEQDELVGDDKLKKLFG